MDEIGKCPVDKSHFMTLKGEKICWSFQRGRCNADLMDFVCKKKCVEMRHVCAVVVQLNPRKLCEEPHPAMNCSRFYGF